MKKLFTLSSALLGMVMLVFSQPQITLVPYATGLPTHPADIGHANDGRLFVLDQTGVINIIQPGGTLLPTPFLDISGKVTTGAGVDKSHNEQGLLGIAFSPNYATDGYFYINYTNKTEIGNSVIARYHVSGNPNVADAASEQILLTLYQPYANHNGGGLRFGNDGYLYCSFGDGGNGGDPGNRAQNKDTLLGKILRIDVSGGGAYTIPASNPFVGAAGADEVWAYGLRNPWRFSFDRLTHNLWIADVGQDSVEEIDYQLASSAGGENYGWRCYEGDRAYNTIGCGLIGNYVAPVYTYRHTPAGECSVTGGFVYRGSAYAALYGYYIFADYCSGDLYTLNADGNFTEASAGHFGGKNFTTFGEDNNGEMYVSDRSSGIIYKITSAPLSAPSINPDISQSRIYPQPNKGTFNCEFTLIKNTRVEVEATDITGKGIYRYEQDFTAGNNILPLNIKVPAGIYLLQLKTVNGAVNHKLVIEE